MNQGQRGGLLDGYRRYMVARGYAPATVSARLSVAADWLRFRRGDIEATYLDVERWAAGRGRGPAGTRNLHVALRAFYRWCQREGLTRHDPTQLADRPRVPAYLPRPAGEDDIARAYTAADTQTRAMLALMSCAGLRCVECSRLDWADVDLHRGTVIVDGKGHRERMVDLCPDAVAALVNLRRHRGPVFVGQGGRRLSPARVSQRVAAAFRAVGADTRAHQLRHRCATNALAEAHGDLLAVRDLLGHANVATTQIYTQITPGRTAATARAMHLPAATLEMR